MQTMGNQSSQTGTNTADIAAKVSKDHSIEYIKGILERTNEFIGDMNEKDVEEKKKYRELANRIKKEKDGSSEWPRKEKEMTMDEFTESKLKEYEKAVEKEEAKKSTDIDIGTGLEKFSEHRYGKHRARYDEYKAMTPEKRADKHRWNFARNTVNHEEYMACPDECIPISIQKVAMLESYLNVFKEYQMVLGGIQRGVNRDDETLKHVVLLATTAVSKCIANIEKRLDEVIWHIKSDIPEAQLRVADLTFHGDTYQVYKLVDDEAYIVHNLLKME